MSETDTDDAYSKFGTVPWRATELPPYETMIDGEAAVWDKKADLVCAVDTALAGDGTFEGALDRAKLIAAAGTAASELPDGYDPVTAIEAINDLLQLAEDVRQQKSWVINDDGSRSRTATKDEVALYQLSGDILRSIQKDTQTNE